MAAAAADLMPFLSPNVKVLRYLKMLLNTSLFVRFFLVVSASWLTVHMTAVLLRSDREDLLFWQN